MKLKTDLKVFWQTWKIVITLAIFKLLIHLLTNTNYSFHRDEFLYLAEGQHLSWGYMEVPPVIAVLGWLAQSLGGSLFVVRLFPALIGSLTVFLSGSWSEIWAGRNGLKFSHVRPLSSPLPSCAAIPYLSR